MSAIGRARPSVSHNAISRHKIKWNIKRFRAIFHEQFFQQHGCQKKVGEFQKENVQQEGS